MIKFLLTLFLISNASAETLDKRLQDLSTKSGCTLIVTSGYRSKAHNKRVGGTKNSYHLKDKARDVVIKQKSCLVTYRELGELAKELFNGVLVYNNHIHVDDRKSIYHVYKWRNRWYKL